MAAFSDAAFSTSGFSPSAFDFGTGAVSTAQVGGKSRKHHKLFVEIDGQHFPVNTVEEGRQLLEQARALAEKLAEKKSDRVVRKLSRKEAAVPHIELTAPAIVVSPELHEQASPLIADIKRLYERAAQNAEIRLLMGKNAPDDEEEFLLLLL